MYKSNCLAIIGLRSGSKSIKNKNIISFKGKPLVYWIIQAAKKSKKINKIIVSTDSKKYAKICENLGAEVPFLRPKKISGDKSLEIEYIIHALKWLKKHQKYTPEYVVRLQATSPLQNAKEIDQSIRALELDKKATSSMVVYKSSIIPTKSMKMSKNNKYLSPYFKEVNSLEIKNRQSFPSAFYRGNVITSRRNLLINKRQQIGKRCKPIIIPEERGIDINTKYDLFVAEKIAQLI